MKISRAGLDFAGQHFDYIHPDGTATSFSEHMHAASRFGSFRSVSIEGARDAAGCPMHVAYNGNYLMGNELHEQLNVWAADDCIEPDVVASIEAMGSDVVDLTGKYFVLLGAGSAMGPLQTLLRHGATVVCIDMPGRWGSSPADSWRRIIDAARQSSGGTVIIPTDPEAQIHDDQSLIDAAGCNILEQPAEILNWLSKIGESKQLTIGNYAYLDGELFVKLTVCADAIVAALCNQRPDTAVAFLSAPTDIQIVSEDMVEAAHRNYLNHDGRGLEKGVNNLTKGRHFIVNDLSPVYAADGSTFHLLDAVSSLQGPNYL